MAEVDKDKLSKQFPSNNYTQIKPKETVGKDLESAKKQVPTKSKMKSGVVEKKPTFGERIANNFMNIDYEAIKDRFLFDVLFPEIISALGDVLRSIFSQDGKGTVRRKRGRGDYTEYSSISDGNSRNREKDITRQNFRKIRIEFYERGDALNVLDDLREMLAESDSGYVYVRDLYSLADLPTHSAMLNWVWHDLEDCRIEPNGGNYALCMPPAEPRRR